MSYKILFINLSIFLFFGFNTYSQQGEVNYQELKGTYSFVLKSEKELYNAKEGDFTLSAEDFKNLEKLRRDEEDVEITLSGKDIIIMSKDKLQANIKWPKYIYETK